MKQKTFGCSKIKEFKTDPDIQEEIKRKDLEDKINRRKEVDIQNQYDKGIRKG